MRAPFKKIGFATGACFLLALLPAIAYLILPVVLDFETAYTLSSYLGIAIFIPAIIGALLVLLSVIIAIVEVATSKNVGDWKAIWIIVLLLIGPIGLALYLFLARKDLK